VTPVIMAALLAMSSGNNAGSTNSGNTIVTVSPTISPTVNVVPISPSFTFTNPNFNINFGTK
jgi:hypothetical protein